jgi:hypothetical protein
MTTSITTSNKWILNLISIGVFYCPIHSYILLFALFIVCCPVFFIQCAWVPHAVFSSVFASSSSFLSPSFFYLLVHSTCRVFFKFSFDHTQAHTTFGRTPLDEGSACCRDLYLTTHKHCTRDKHPCPRWIRTHDPSKCTAADLRLRPPGHWDRFASSCLLKFYFVFLLFLFTFIYSNPIPTFSHLMKPSCLV